MEAGLLIIRLVVGALLAGHGAQKLFGLFGGNGIEGTAGFFEQIGLRPGKLHATAAGSAEFFGGLALAAGLLTPLAAAAIVGVMTAAIITVHARNGVWATDNGYEYNATIIAVVVSIASIGAGGWSLDGALGLDIAGIGWGLGAFAAGILGGLGAVASGKLDIAAPRDRHLGTAGR